MTRLRPAAALAGFALLAQLSSGCCGPRPLLGRLNYCGPVLNRPLFVANPHAAPVGVAVAAPHAEVGGYPVGLPVGGGAPGCASCGGGGAPIGMAPGGYPHDAFAHGPVGGPPGQFAVGVPPQFTGYPTTVIGQPAPLGGPTGGPNVSRELPPPQIMPKQ